MRNTENLYEWLQNFSTSIAILPLETSEIFNISSQLDYPSTFIRTQENREISKKLETNVATSKHLTKQEIVFLPLAEPTKAFI